MTDHTVTQADLDAAETFLRRHQRTPNSLVYDLAELIHVHNAAIQAERAGRQAAEQEPVWPDDYILTVKVYLDGQPGYSHELRRDCPQDITNLLGSIEGELDCVEGVIRVLWPNHTEWQEFHAAANLILRAADVLRDLQKRQTHGRIILKFDGNDLMYLTQFIMRAEWEATSDQEFAGW